MPLDPEVAARLERQKTLPLRSSPDVAGTRDMLRRDGALAGERPMFPRVRRYCCSGILEHGFIAVDYGLAPEHLFPAAPEDAFRAVEWASNQGVSVALAR